MIKKLAWIMAAAMAFSALPRGASAIENGVSAEGDSRIVSLYRGSVSEGSVIVYHPMCSGYLITDLIVATVQHCTMDPDKGLPRDPSELLVGFPGEKSNLLLGRQIPVRAVFRAANYKKYDTRTDLSFTNDVAVLVLAKPVPNVGPAKLLNEIEFNSLITENPQIWIGGYGYQNFEQRSGRQDRSFVIPAKAPARFADNSEFQAAIVHMKQSWNRVNYQESLVGLQMATATGTVCDGDSGSGFWTIKNSQAIYLGVSNGALAITNCFGGVADGPISFIGVHPTYQYQSLFDSAANYVKKNPVKIILTCKKGKVTKKVTALKPKCPLGYKKA